MSVLQETRVGLAGRADGRDSQDWPATIVGTDPDHDLAVLRIQAPADVLKPVRLGTSNDLKVGQSLYAIGFPYGLSRTLTAGVVSGLNREIPNPAGTKTRGAIQVLTPCSTAVVQIYHCYLSLQASAEAAIQPCAVKFMVQVHGTVRYMQIVLISPTAEHSPGLDASVLIMLAGGNMCCVGCGCSG